MITACRPRTPTASRTWPIWPTCRRGPSATTSPRGCCRRPVRSGRGRTTRTVTSPGCDSSGDSSASTCRWPRSGLRLAGLDDDAIATLVDTEPLSPARGIGARLRPGGPRRATDASGQVASPRPSWPLRHVGRSPSRWGSTPPLARLAEREPVGAIRRPVASRAPRSTRPSRPGALPVGPRRAHADIELHIRRPLSRQQNKQVDRLIAIARELLEEDPS